MAVQNQPDVPVVAVSNQVPSPGMTWNHFVRSIEAIGIVGVLAFGIWWFQGYLLSEQAYYRELSLGLNDQLIDCLAGRTIATPTPPYDVEPDQILWTLPDGTE